uniref:Uncharacterized protein n=1 Tax=Anguilla anguilla TaxID=7936 RepID=A0A0E9R1H7_ANGAN
MAQWLWCMHTAALFKVSFMVSMLCGSCTGYMQPSLLTVPGSVQNPI